jgi:hypothetical protein
MYTLIILSTLVANEASDIRTVVSDGLTAIPQIVRQLCLYYRVLTIYYSGSWFCQMELSLFLEFEDGDCVCGLTMRKLTVESIFREPTLSL